MVHRLLATVALLPLIAWAAKDEGGSRDRTVYFFFPPAWKDVEAVDSWLETETDGKATKQEEKSMFKTDDSRDPSGAELVVRNGHLGQKLRVGLPGGEQSAEVVEVGGERKVTLLTVGARHVIAVVENIHHENIRHKMKNKFFEEVKNGKLPVDAEAWFPDWLDKLLKEENNAWHVNVFADGLATNIRLSGGTDSVCPCKRNDKSISAGHWGCSWPKSGGAANELLLKMSTVSEDGVVGKWVDTQKVTKGGLYGPFEVPQGGRVFVSITGSFKEHDDVWRKTNKMAHRAAEGENQWEHWDGVKKQWKQSGLEKATPAADDMDGDQPNQDVLNDQGGMKTWWHYVVIVVVLVVVGGVGYYKCMGGSTPLPEVSLSQDMLMPSIHGDAYELESVAFVPHRGSDEVAAPSADEDADEAGIARERSGGEE